MSIGVAPSQPWRPEATRGAVRGAVVVRLATDHEPRALPHRADVAAGRAIAPLRIDERHVDSTIHKFSPAMRATSVFRPASRIRGKDANHRAWDDLEHETGLSRTYCIEVDPDADLVTLVDALRQLERIELASPVYLSVTPFAAAVAPAPAATPPSTPATTRAVGADAFWAYDMIGSAEALEIEPGDRALIVGVVDSGVDLGHPELRERLRPGIDTVDLRATQVPRSVQIISDATRPDHYPMDTIGHGTACAAIIAARGEHLPPGVGGAGPVVAGRALAGARIVGRSTMTAIGSLLDIDHALKTVIDLGARVINCSFGTPASALRDDDARPHAEIVAYARRRGVVLVAASGNSGTFESYYPACLDGVIAVGACDASGRPTSFMSRGDHVDLCAPGDRIPGATVGGFAVHTGTSFAAPFVTGACALLIAHGNRASEPIAAADVREILMRSTRPFPRRVDVRGCGTGVLDIPAALKAWDAAAAAHTGPPGDRDADDSRGRLDSDPSAANVSLPQRLPRVRS